MYGVGFVQFTFWYFKWEWSSLLKWISYSRYRSVVGFMMSMSVNYILYVRKLTNIDETICLRPWYQE